MKSERSPKSSATGSRTGASGRFRFEGLSLEISLALVAKLILLVGLWLIIFRPGGHKPPPQPDIGERFHLPSPPASESPYVR